MSATDPLSELRMQTAHLAVPVNDRDHVSGRRSAPVELVEYGDFECPHSARAHPIIETAQRYLADDLCFVYRYFSLNEIHPHAQLAAESAVSAGEQGRFWQMHDTLFRHRNALELDDLLDYAQSIGCDPTRVAAELAAGTHTARVLNDARGGLRSGVRGTPAFFVNGVRYDGPWADPTVFIGLLSHTATLAHAMAHH
jgi:protein-disulfide isomerase